MNPVSLHDLILTHIVSAASVLMITFSVCVCVPENRCGFQSSPSLLTCVFHPALPCLCVSLCQVEEFKNDPSPSKCLHSVFNVDTGDEVYTYSDYHHLQVSPGPHMRRNYTKAKRFCLGQTLKTMSCKNDS